MKNLLLKLLRLIGRAKVADLDNDGKIEALSEEIQGLFAQFKTMSDKLEETNNQLVEVVEDEGRKQEAERERLERIKREVEQKIEESIAVQEKAMQNIDKNMKLKSKVDEFTV